MCPPVPTLRNETVPIKRYMSVNEKGPLWAAARTAVFGTCQFSMGGSPRTATPTANFAGWWRGGGGGRVGNIKNAASAANLFPAAARTLSVLRAAPPWEGQKGAFSERFR